MKAGGTKTIGLFLISQATGYQRQMAEQGAEAARRLGFDVEVSFADDTAAKQSADVMRFLHAHADAAAGVVIMPVSDLAHEQAIDGLARRVLSRGVPWLALNRELEGHVRRMRGEFPDVPVAMVAVDHREIGRLQWRQARKLLPAKGGTLLYVIGNVFTSSARDRREGLLEGIDQNVTVHQLEGLWSSESARELVHRWVSGQVTRHSPLDVVVCQNDPMALGARQALERLADELGRPHLRGTPVLGVDGLPDEGRRLVDAGTLSGTVIVPLSAVRAVELLAEALQTRKVPAPRINLAPDAYPAGSA